MSGVPDELFQFLAAARGAANMATLDEAFAELIGRWGFNRWTAIPISGAVSIRPFQTVFGRPSDSWSKHYREKNYFRRDAAIRALLHSADSIWWNAFARAARLSPEERRLFAEAKEHGIAEGLSAPVRLPGGSVWVCALTGPETDPDWQVGDAARYAAERYVVRALQLQRMEGVGVDPSGLTPGQCSIVRLLADGLNAKEVGRALNISPRTVYNQISAAKQRLGVRRVGELIRRVLVSDRLL